jgi:SPP1 gp7 family putative phage head morphogenesis protein
MPALNERDPSGLRATEERRARQLTLAYDDLLKAVLKRVRAGSITDPGLISQIVSEEAAKFAVLQQAKVLKWAEDSASRATIRAVQQIKAAGVKTALQLGPQPIPDDVRKALRANVLNDIESLAVDTKKIVVRELTAGISAGEGMDELRRRLQRETAMSRNRADLIARTETMDAFNTVARRTFANHGAIGVRIFTAQDERRCRFCGARHGKVYPIDEGLRPPYHPRCRCVEEPVFTQEEAAEELD